MHSIIAGKTTNISERFILSNESMTWDEGQSYCRHHYTDLASVRNLAESRKIGNMVPKGNWAWIGLFRDWSWSDQSNSSFRYRHSGNRYGNCVSVYDKSGKWEDYTCETKLPFCCYGGELQYMLLCVCVRLPYLSVPMTKSRW